MCKKKVYRHLLFNRLGRDDDELDVGTPAIPNLTVMSH